MSEKRLLRSGFLLGRLLLPGLLVFFLLACGGEYKKNRYLGRIPSIEKKYYEKVLELFEGGQTGGDLSGTLPMIFVFDQLEKEWDDAINQEVRINRFDKAIPVEMPDGLPLEIGDAVVDHVSRGNVVLKFQLKFLDPSSDPRGLILVFEALDQKGNALANTLSIATSFDQDNDGRELWELFGLWETESIIALENLDRIRVIRIDGL